MQGGDRSQSRARQKHRDSGRAISEKGCRGRPLRCAHVCAETWTEGGREPHLCWGTIRQFSQNFPLTPHKQNSLPLPKAQNICLLLLASKTDINHSLFEQTHTYKLIQINSSNDLFYWSYLRGKKKHMYFKHGVTLYETIKVCCYILPGRQAYFCWWEKSNTTTETKLKEKKWCSKVNS